MSVIDLLAQSCQVDVETSDVDVVAYDQSTSDVNALAADSFLVILLDKLANNFKAVYFLKGLNKPLSQQLAYEFGQLLCCILAFCSGEQTLIAAKHMIGSR